MKTVAAPATGPAPLPLPMRVISALLVALVHLALLALLLQGLRLHDSVRLQQRRDVIALTLPASPAPPVRPPVKRIPRRSGRAAPAGLRSRATPVAAHRPVVPLPVPSPVIAAPVPNQGVAATQGAADRPGPGPGAGGQGNGTGAGNGGNDAGSGLDELDGALRWRDLPGTAKLSRFSGHIVMRLTFDANARVAQCRILQSSGERDLDAATCTLATRRLRFHPGAGSPAGQSITYDQDWTLNERPGGPADPP